MSLCKSTMEQGLASHRAERHVSCPSEHLLGWTTAGGTCRPTGRDFFISLSPQGKRKCECKSHYVGDGLDCEPEQLPIDRCLQDNGQCHADADCADLHFQGQCGPSTWSSGLGKGLLQNHKEKVL